MADLFVARLANPGKASRLAERTAYIEARHTAFDHVRRTHHGLAASTSLAASGRIARVLVAGLVLSGSRQDET